MPNNINTGSCKEPTLGTPIENSPKSPRDAQQSPEMPHGDERKEKQNKETKLALYPYLCLIIFFKYLCLKRSTVRFGE